MGSHINKDGLFQSDKYPSCPAGKVPLSTKDKNAQPFLWGFAQVHRAIDAEFSDDLEAALRASGYEGTGVLKATDTRPRRVSKHTGDCNVWCRDDGCYEVTTLTTRELADRVARLEDEYACLLDVVTKLASSDDRTLVIRARLAAGISWNGEDGGSGNKTESQEPEVRRILRACAKRIEERAGVAPDAREHAVSDCFAHEQEELAKTSGAFKPYTEE